MNIGMTLRAFARRRFRPVVSTCNITPGGGGGGVKKEASRRPVPDELG